MLIITSDKRLDDVFVGEYMRLFNHFYFRDIVNRLIARDEKIKSPYLKSNDSWTDKYYISGSAFEKERKLFSNQKYYKNANLEIN